MNVFKSHMLATAARVSVLAFDNNGWKKDANGNLVLDASGDPIYINAAGQETSIKSDAIANLNAEAKTHRTAKERAEADLAKYRTPDGKLVDPDLAIKAIETVSKIDLKKLIDAGEVDKVRSEIASQYTSQLAEKDTALSERDKRIADMSVDKVFDASDFIRERINMPRDFFVDTIRKNFKYEDGKVQAYDRNGNAIYSKKNPGQFADADEAIELIVDQHPQKDNILKAPAGGGSGNGGGGGNRGSGRVMRRSEFNGLDPQAQGVAAQAMNKGELTVVD